MPVPNDLTPEDEALFAEHGIPSAGPGGEPINENQAEVIEPIAPPVPEGPARDEQGRFAPSTPAAAPQEPIQPAEQTPGGELAPPPPGFVPHAALHESREREKAVKAQLLTLQARTNAILAQSQPQTLDLPDLDTDPVGYVRALGETLRQNQEQAAQETQRTRLDQAFEEDEALFASYTPDYNQAAEHFAVSRMTELSQFYPRDQVQQIMVDEAREIARMAWQKGVPAAQMVYQMAQARGYRTGPPAAAPAPAPAAPTPINAAATVAAARTNQANGGRSLSGAAGAGAAATLNAEALLSMSDEDFENYLKLGEKGANQRFAAIG